MQVIHLDALWWCGVWACHLTAAASTGCLWESVKKRASAEQHVPSLQQCNRPLGENGGHFVQGLLETLCVFIYSAA